MLDERKIEMLVGLVQRGKIKIDDIKDENYRKAVEEMVMVNK